MEKCILINSINKEEVLDRIEETIDVAEVDKEEVSRVGTCSNQVWDNNIKDLLISQDSANTLVDILNKCHSNIKQVHLVITHRLEYPHKIYHKYPYHK